MEKFTIIFIEKKLGKHAVTSFQDEEDFQEKIKQFKGKFRIYSH